MADKEAPFHVVIPVAAKIIARVPRLTIIQEIGVGMNTSDLAMAPSPRCTPVQQAQQATSQSSLK
jgi:phosphoglycerate dehydrogenase-like enzyme